MLTRRKLLLKTFELFDLLVMICPIAMATLLSHGETSRMHSIEEFLCPRPLPIRDYSGFEQGWQRRRFSVRPGITCLWQINGRSNASFDHWMKMDMEYIDKWSLGLDLKILAKTIPAVLRGSGAA